MRFTKEEVVGLLNDIFENGIAIQTHLIPKILEDKIGRKFEYDKEICHCVNNNHKNLVGFLKCYSDIFSIVKYSEHFLIYKNVSRKDEFLKLVGLSEKFHFHDPNYRGIIESLVCRMFPIKCSILYKDLNEIFNFVYKVDLESLIVSADFFRLVSKFNIMMKASNRGNSLRITPVYNQDFSPDEEYAVAYEEVNKLLTGLLTASNTAAKSEDMINEKFSIKKLILRYDRIKEKCRTKNIEFDLVIDFLNSNLPTTVLNDNLISPGLMGILDDIDKSLTSSRILHLFTKNK